MISYVRESAEFVAGADWANDVTRETEGALVSVDGENYEELLHHADNLRRFVQNCENNLKVMSPEEFFSWARSQLG